jgi:replicative DNA helicase
MEKQTINKIGKIQPQSSEVEIFVLGTILIDSNAMDKVAKEFTPNLFFVDQNRIIAESIIDLYKAMPNISVMSQVAAKYKEYKGKKLLTDLFSKLTETQRMGLNTLLSGRPLY